MEERQALQYQAYIGQLTGAKITFAGVADDNEEGYIPFIQVELTDGRKLTIEGVDKLIGLPQPNKKEASKP